MACFANKDYFFDVFLHFLISKMQTSLPFVFVSSFSPSLLVVYLELI